MRDGKSDSARGTFVRSVTAAKSRLLALIGVLLVGALGVAGCGGGTGSDASPMAGPEDGEPRQMVMFGFDPAGDNYMQTFYTSLREAASESGWELKLLTTPFDQNVQNNQVMQELSVGNKPDAYAWMPVDQNAGLGSLRKLNESGIPVVQSLSQPIPEAEPFIEFYTGTSFAANGEGSVEPIMAARDQLAESGTEMHGANGNLVTISWPEALSFSAIKLDGLETGFDEVDAKPDWIDRQYAPTTDSPGGFKAMNTAIAKVGNEGIDIVYAFNDGMGGGAINALKAAGLKPGKDVMVVGGNCFGDFTSLIDGTQFSTMVVAAPLEARMFVATLNSYFASGGEVEEGTFTPPADPNEFPEMPEVPSKNNLVPQPPLIVGQETPEANRAVIDDATLWGEKVSDLCGVGE